MIQYETQKPTLTGARATIYAFAKKYGLGEDDAERIFLKIGPLASEENFLAEAELVSPNREMPNTKAKKL